MTYTPTPTLYHCLPPVRKLMTYTPTPTLYHCLSPVRKLMRYTPTSTLYHCLPPVRKLMRYTPTPTLYHCLPPARKLMTYTPTLTLYHCLTSVWKKNKSGGTGADKRRQTTGKSGVRNGQSGQSVDDDMYAVPNKEPKQSGTNVTAGAEYSEINSDPPPAIPLKSAQLEEYLETKPLEQETLPSGYAEIGVLDKNPTRDVTKSQTLQPLSRPLPNSSMSENPLYATQSFVNRTKSLHIPAENVYEAPTVPSPVVTEEANTENIYETVYSEPIQPSLFTSRATSRDASDNTTLCPYTLPFTLFLLHHSRMERNPWSLLQIIFKKSTRWVWGTLEE